MQSPIGTAESPMIRARQALAPSKGSIETTGANNQRMGDDDTKTRVNEDGGGIVAASAPAPLVKRPTPGRSSDIKKRKVSFAGLRGDKVPDDPWTHIYQFVPYRDLGTCVSISKTLQDLGKPYKTRYRHWNLRASEVR